MMMNGKVTVSVAPEYQGRPFSVRLTRNGRGWEIVLTYNARKRLSAHPDATRLAALASRFYATRDAALRSAAELENGCYGQGRADGYLEPGPGTARR